MGCLPSFSTGEKRISQRPITVFMSLQIACKGLSFLPARGCAFQKTSYDATPRANIKTTRSVDFFGETKLKSKGVSTSGQEPFLGVNKNLWLKVKLPLFPLKILHWISLYRKSGHLGFYHGFSMKYKGSCYLLIPSCIQMGSINIKCIHSSLILQGNC